MRMFNLPILGSLVVFGLSVSQPAAADSAITLRADEWCPYNCVPGAERPGYMIEIVREVFEARGHPVDYQALNWMRSIEDTRRGRYTAIVGAVPEEAPDFIFGPPLGASTDGFAVRTDSDFDFAGAGSFDGLRLGAIAGYEYTDEVSAYIERHAQDRSRVQLTAGDDALEQNLRKLSTDRVDVVVDDANVLRLAIKELGLEDELEVVGHDTPDPVYVAFSPAHDRAHEFAQMLGEGVEQLRASGRLEEILDRYGLEDWQETLGPAAGS